MKDPLDDSLDWTTPFESGSARGVSRRLTTWRPLSCCCLLLLLAVVAGFALQTCAQTGTTGGLEGVVLDPSGAYVTRVDNPFANCGLGQNTLAPRVGFAWQISAGERRLVLRGGYAKDESLRTIKARASPSLMC